MHSLSSGSERDWQAAIDPAFQARLLRPLAQPGVIRFEVARQILTRSQKLRDRLPLLEQLQRRQPPAKVTGGKVPIVYAEPSGMENPRNTEAQRRTETGGRGESTSPRSPASPVIQAKFAPGAGPATIAATGMAHLPVSAHPKGESVSAATPNLSGVTAQAPATTGGSGVAATADQRLPVVTEESAIVPHLSPLPLGALVPEQPEQATPPLPPVPVETVLAAAPVKSDLPLVSVTRGAIVTRVMGDREPFNIQNPSFPLQDATLLSEGVPLGVPHSPGEGGFRESFSGGQTFLENPPLQSVLPRVRVDQGIVAPAALPTLPLPIAANSASPSAQPRDPAIPGTPTTAMPFQSSSIAPFPASQPLPTSGRAGFVAPPTPGSPPSVKPDPTTQNAPPPMPNLDALTDQIERRLARRLAIARERRGW